MPNTSSSGVLSELFKGSFTGSAGTQTIASIQPTINQSGTAGYTALKSLTDVQTDTCLKIVLRSGSLIFVPCTVALNEAVSLNDGSINKVKASFNGNNRLTRYSA